MTIIETSSLVVEGPPYPEGRGPRKKSGRLDSNQRPLGPQPSALPDCATPRSGRPDSNRHRELGRLLCDRYTTPAWWAQFRRQERVETTEPGRDQVHRCRAATARAK